MNKKKMLYLIFLAISIIITGTLAYYSVATSRTALVLVLGERDEVLVTLKPFEINGTLMSTVDYTSFETNNVENDYIQITAQNYSDMPKKVSLYYRVNDIDASLVSDKLKYSITSSTTIDGTYTEIKTGNFSSAADGFDMSVYTTELPADTTVFYRIFTYLDGNEDVSGMTGSVLDAEVRAEMDYVIIPDLDDGMIPVKVDASGNYVTISADDSDWFDYEEHVWANVVLVSESSRERYLETSGITVSNNDVLAAFVWIPRFEYRYDNLGYGYAGGTQYSPGAISINFIPSYITLPTSNGYMIHPAFTFGDEVLSGFWVGKYETGGTTDTPLIKDNDVLDNINQVSMFETSLKFNGGMLNNGFVSFGGSDYYGTTNNFDSHMMKRSEWGAMFYLSHSIYGTCTSPTLCHKMTNTDTTTTTENSSSNIAANSGIYNTSATNDERLMGVLQYNGDYIYSGSNPSENSGFIGYMGDVLYDTSEYVSMPPQKYYDRYTSTSISTGCNGEKCYGHAMDETAHWYSNGVGVLSASSPWTLVRDLGTNYSNGGAISNQSFRTVIVKSTSQLDTTPPICTLSAVEGEDVAADSGESYVTINITATDEGSGIATNGYHYLESEGWTNISTRQANVGEVLDSIKIKDNAGNVTECGSVEASKVYHYNNTQGAYCCNSDKSSCEYMLGDFSFGHMDASSGLDGIMLGCRYISCTSGYTYSGIGCETTDYTEQAWANPCITPGGVKYTAKGCTWTVVGGDTTAPTVQFSQNGNSTLSATASTIVTLSDESTIVNRRYLWSTTPDADASSNQPYSNFSSGDTITNSTDTGTYYLCIYAEDSVGNSTNVCSNAFKIDNTGPRCEVTANSYNIYITASDSAGIDGYHFMESEGWISSSIKRSPSNVNFDSIKVKDRLGNITECGSSNFSSTYSFDPSKVKCCSTSSSTCTYSSGNANQFTSLALAQSSCRNLCSNIVLDGTAATYGGIGCSESDITTTNLIDSFAPDGTRMSQSWIVAGGDKTGPEVQFTSNGNTTQATSHASAVTVDDESTITVKKYLWASSSNADASNGTSFENGKSLSYSANSGTYYLCIYARDAIGNETNECSNAFEFGGDIATITNLNVNITGSLYVGRTLTASTTSDVSGATYSYKWYSNNTNSNTGGTQIGTGSTYLLTENERGKYIYVDVTASSNNYLSAYAISSPKGIVYQTYTHTVYFIANGATISNGNTTSTTTMNLSCSVSTISASVPSCSVTSPTIARVGYDAVGWGNAANATTANYAPGAKITLNSSQTFYAIATPSEGSETYTVTFDSNGGSTVDTSITVVSGSNYGVLPTPTKSGNYSFNGWYTSATGGTKVTSNTTVATNENHTLYAQWDHYFTATFNPNGLTIIVSGQSFTTPTVLKCIETGGRCLITSPTILKSGHITGWGTSVDDTTNTISSGAVITLTSDKTYYALDLGVDSVAPTCAVNINGYTVTIDATDENGVAGYQFSESEGWISNNYKYSSSPVTYNSLKVRDNAGNVTECGSASSKYRYYYQQNTVYCCSSSYSTCQRYSTISIYSYHDSLSSATSSCENLCSSLTLEGAPAVYSSGCSSSYIIRTLTYNGTTPDGTTLSSWTITGNDTTGPEVQFTSNGNTTQATSHASTVTFDDESTITARKYLWSSSSNADASNGTSFENGKSLSYFANSGTYYLCIYARDAIGNETNECSNAFEFGGDIATITNLNVNITGSLYVGQKLTASSTSDVSGATYSYKWYSNTTNSNTGGTQIGTGSTYTLTENERGKYIYVDVAATANNYLSAYAIGSPRGKVYKTYTHTATFNANGATISNGSTTSTTTMNLSCSVSTISDSVPSCDITSPTIARVGYDAVGWGNVSNATTANHASGSKITLNSSRTFYAIATPSEGSETYTVTFDPNGGSIVDTSITVVSGSNYGVLPTPTRSGDYIFDGWYTSATGGTKVTSNTTVATNENHTLYAQWKGILRVTFSPNGNRLQLNGATYTTSISLSCYHTDGSCDIISPTIYNPGYATGWGTSVDDTSNTILPGSTITLTSNQTYYALNLGVDNVAPTCTVNARSNTVTIDATDENGITGYRYNSNQQWTSNNTASTTSNAISVKDSAENITNCGQVAFQTFYGYQQSTSSTCCNPNNPSQCNTSYLYGTSGNIYASYNEANTACRNGCRANYTFSGSCMIMSGTNAKSILPNGSSYIGSKQWTIAGNDTSGPIIEFTSNGNSTLATRHATAVTFYDDSTVDQNKYLWSTSPNADASNGTSFDSGTGISYSATSGTYYLCIYAEDAIGNETNVCTNAFEFGGNMQSVPVYSSYYNGSAYVGETMTITYNAGADSYSYTWYSSETNNNVVSKATQIGTGQSYTITENELGKYLFVVVTAEKTGYLPSTIVSRTTSQVKKKYVHTATFNANGATITSGSTTSTTSINMSCTAYATDATVPSCIVTSPTISIEGYDVIGWQATSAPTTSIISSGAQISLNSNQTYDAITTFLSTTYTATFNANGSTINYSGTTSTTSLVLTCFTTPTNNSCTITSPTITPLFGYKENGWVNASNSSDTVTSGGTVTLSANKTYNAIIEEDNSGTVMLVKKANAASITTYSSGNTGEMYTFSQPATSQVGATTDYRYIGNTPNNYITFNNETWRIIGVFDGKIKIIKDTSIGDMYWDYKKYGIGSSTGNFGSNDWVDSQLMYMLNPSDIATNVTKKSGYTFDGTYVKDANNKIIYQTGCQPAETDGESYTCTPNTWSLNATALTQVADVTYYLGGGTEDSNYDTTPEIYTWERGVVKYNAIRNTNWIGKVGLMYPSDYGYTFAYGVDGACYNDLYYCRTANGGTPSSSWLFNSVISQWTIAHNSVYGNVVFNVSSTGPVSYYGALYEFGVRPVVYLKPDIMLSGSGTSGDKYRIVS